MVPRKNQKIHPQSSNSITVSETPVTAVDSPAATVPPQQAPSQRQLLREAEVCARTRRHRSSLWRDVKSGSMPSPIRLGPNSIAWYEDEISEWIANRPRVRPTTESE